MAKKNKTFKPTNLSWLIEDEEAMTQISDVLDARYTRYSDEREEEDAKIEVASGMRRCFMNKALGDIEREAAGNDGEKDATEREDGGDDMDVSLTVANSASTRFARAVTQNAAVFNAVTSAQDRQWEYDPVKNDLIWADNVEDEAQAEVRNLLAEESLRVSGWAYKKQDAFTDLITYSDLSFTIRMETKYKEVRMLSKDGNGVTSKRMKVLNHPVVEQLPWESLFVDKHIPTIQAQNCIFITSSQAIHEIEDDNKAFGSEDQIKKVMGQWKNLLHNVADNELEEDLRTNDNDEDTQASDTDLRRWDVYYRVKLDKKGKKVAEIDDLDGKWTLLWFVGYGSSPKNAIWVKCLAKFDPDDEIPIKHVNVLPGGGSQFYHPRMSEAARPLYAQECTFLNLAIDAAAKQNLPPVLWNKGRFSRAPKSLRLVAGANYEVENIQGAVQEMSQAEKAGIAVELIKILQGQQDDAYTLNPNSMGEKFGNISATENMAANGATRQPQLASVSYVLLQLYPWMGSRISRYWEAYGDKDMIMQICKMPLGGEGTIGEIYGDFNININIVSTYEDRITQSSMLTGLIQMIASNEKLLESSEHKVEIYEFLKEIMTRGGIKNASRLVTVKSGDASYVQTMENTMIWKNVVDGENADPTPEENQDHLVHISVIDGELLNIHAIAQKATMDESPDETQQQYLAYDERLRKHKESHESMRGRSGPNAPKAPTQLTPGQESGLEQSAQMGAQLGGANNAVRTRG